jgi:hypothetical protein
MAFDPEVRDRICAAADTNATVDAAYTESTDSQPSALDPIVAETAATTTGRLGPA